MVTGFCIPDQHKLGNIFIGRHCSDVDCPDHRKFSCNQSSIDEPCKKFEDRRVGSGKWGVGNPTRYFPTPHSPFSILYYLLSKNTTMLKNYFKVAIRNLLTNKV